VITVGEPEVASPSPLPEIEPGIVPDLNGVGEGDAYKLLDQAGLAGASTVAPVADVANGLVASTDPPAGTRVDAGTVVTLRVSGTTAFGEGVVSALDCPSEDQMPFALDIEIPPGTSTFHVLTTTQEVGSKPGDVFAAREEQNATGDTVVVWHVVRADLTIAILADDPLEGVACRGSGFGGV